MSQQQINALETEIDGKIAGLRSEWEEEKEEVNNEKSFWQSALLSLTEMIHRASSGQHVHT